MNLHEIKKLTEKPEIYKNGTATMWTDEHISKQLLKLHLDENIDLASRKRSTVVRTAKWILRQIKGNNLNILDLGCGPGLYAEILFNQGHKVTGVDFSKSSIDFAKKEAASKNLGITYINQNYLDLNFTNKFDVVMLIYTDFGVLLPAEREKLLFVINKALKPGGKLIFDVLNDKDIDQKVSARTWDLTDAGFWMNKPYFALSDSFLFKKNKVILYQHVVIDELDNHNIYRFWTHFFDNNDLTNILSKHHFININLYKNVLPESDHWNGDNVTFCVANKI